MKKFLADILGPRLRAYRREKALTSIVCAKAVGVSQPAWNMWEMGVRLPKIELLTEICDLLGVTPNDLLGYDGGTKSTAVDFAKPSIQNSGSGSPVIIGTGNAINAPVSVTVTAPPKRRRKPARKPQPKHSKPKHSNHPPPLGFSNFARPVNGGFNEACNGGLRGDA